MKKNGTRLLSLLLVLTMVLSFAPTAFAAEPEVAAPAEEESYDSSWGAWEDSDPAEAPVEEEQPEEPAEEPAEDPAEEPVAEEEPALVEEPVAEEEPVEVTYPANTFFYVGGTGLRVTVDAPEGAFPADARMIVNEVRPDAVQDVVTNAGVQGEVLIAADISFRNAEGAELEPDVPVEVAVTASMPKAKDLKVVHIGDDNAVEEVNQLPEGAAVSTASVQTASDARTLRFEAKSFSVYAVIGEGETGDNARATVNFYGKNTSTPVATFYVKNADLGDDAVLNVIVYDPGVDGLGAKEIFKGWSISSKGTTDGLDYTVDTQPKTIDDVRTFLKGQTFAEGDVYNIYAMIFQAYNVQFKDEDNVMIHGETLISKSNEAVSYKINTDYTPKTEDQQFQGWYAVTTQDDAITPVKDVYAFQETVSIKGDVTFTPNAPDGKWLVFDGNVGTDTQNKPSYTPPQFVKKGLKPDEPDDPTRVGYTFGGWYKDAACTEGNEFNFDATVETRTTVYAKWTLVSSANYTVIIWKQNVALDGYDYAESFQLSGAPNTTVSTVSGSGDTATITGRPGGSTVRYTGFTFGHNDTNVTIKANGTSVVNVYFDRKQYTLTFQIYNNRRWNTVKTITAYYEQDISANFPITVGNTSYDGYVWYAQNSSIYGSGEIWVPYIDVMREENTTFHGDRMGTSGTRHYRYYTECLPGERGDVTFDGKQFNLHADVGIDCAWNGFYATYEEDFSTMDAFSRYKSDPALNPGGRVNVPSSGMNFYYTRDKYPILYNDGIYVNGDGVATGQESRGNLKTTPESDYVYYQASLADMEDYFTPTYPGYVFVGWFLDESCTQPFDWSSTMPKGGIKLYAKWVAVQYRIFLHANVDPSDTSLDWGGQSMCFRVDEDEKLANGNKIIGTRDEYEIVGWYTDEAFTNPFNFDAYTINSGLPYLADYDQTEPTELNKYSKPESDTTNHDKTGGRIWITKKLDLYAKWRGTMKDGRGIQVIYDALDGVNSANNEKLYTDPLYYLDDANAIAQPASIPTDSANLHFVKWHVQKWNGSAWEDSGVIASPGDSFQILKANAKKEANPDWDGKTENEQYLYTIMVVAEYGPKQPPVDTHIDWYFNDGTGKDPIHVDDKLQINEAVLIHDAQTRTGYKFLGWAKKNEYEDDEADPKVAIKDYPDVTEEDLFLKWDADKEQYFIKDSEGNWTVAVEKVAADEILPYEALYAVWYAEFYVYHSGVKGGEIETIVVTPDMETFDLTKPLTVDGKTIYRGVTAGTLYGGYYLEGGFTTPATIDENTPAYDGTVSTWKWVTPQTKVAGNVIVPVPGETYYIKEVPAAKYLQAYTHYTYFTTTGKIGSLFMISDIDDLNYGETGVVITDNLGSKVYKTLTIEASATGKKVTLKPNTVFYGKAAATNYLTCSDDVKGSVEGKTMVMYWITPDGATVTGTVSRQLSNVVTQGSITCVNGSVDSEITFKS